MYTHIHPSMYHCIQPLPLTLTLKFPVQAESEHHVQIGNLRLYRLPLFLPKWNKKALEQIFECKKAIVDPNQFLSIEKVYNLKLDFAKISTFNFLKNSFLDSVNGPLDASQRSRCKVTLSFSN